MSETAEPLWYGHPKFIPYPADFLERIVEDLIPIPAPLPSAFARDGEFVVAVGKGLHEEYWHFRGQWYGYGPVGATQWGTERVRSMARWGDLPTPTPREMAFLVALDPVYLSNVGQALQQKSRWELDVVHLRRDMRRCSKERY